MKVNYVLMYGTPYLKYKEFEKFDEISKYLVNKGICNYRIFEPMEDLKEMEMIHLENDVRVLEGKIKQLQSQLKAKEESEKEFIKYLEAEKDRLAREVSQIYEDSLGKTKLVNEDIFNEINNVLSKFNEILSKGENK